MFSACTAPALRRLRAMLVSVALIGGLGMVMAQTPQNADWSVATSAATGVALDLDASGNATVLGVQTPTAFDAGVGTLTLDRIGPQGARVWSQTWLPPAATGALAGARPLAIFNDATGNTFVLGSYEAWNYCVSTNGSCPTTGPIGVFSVGWMVLKFGPDGTLLWQRLQASTGFAAARGVADAAGNVYVMIDPRAPGRTMPTVKLSGLDGSTLWTRLTNDGAKPGHMALAPSGNLLISTAANISGMTVLEYAAADGSVVWSRRYAQGAGYYVTGLGVNAQGDVAVSGTTTGGVFVAAFDAARNPLFEATYPEGSSAPLVAVNALRQVYVSGATAPTTGTTAPYANWYTLKLDAAGNRVLPASIVDAQALAHEVPYDMALSPDGAVYVAGSAGPGLANNASATPATVRRMLADGSTAWSARQVEAGAAIDVAAGADGSAYALGNSPATLWHYAAAANLPPVAGLVLSPPANPAPLAAYLDASGSHDPDGSISSYRWNFGDGATTATASPLAIHTYAAPGSYTVSVVPVDNLGLAGAAASVVANVTQPVVVAVPTSLSFSSTSVVGGKSVTGTVRVSTTTGAVVKLTSSRPTVASVPASISIPVGASSAKFTVRTTKVSSATAVTITATANGSSVSSALNVTR